MSSTKTAAAGLLFALQIALSWAFTVPQIKTSLSSTQGMTITWSLFCTAFCVVNFLLAYGAWRESKNKFEAGMIPLVYLNWAVLWFAMFVIVAIKAPWYRKDTVLTVLVALSIIVLLVTRRKETFRETITEPITRGIASLLFKSVPQFYLGYAIVSAGGNNGLAGATLAIGHVTVCIRLGEIGYSISVNGWTRKNVGLFMSEAGNELSWLFVTAMWFAYRR